MDLTLQIETETTNTSKTNIGHSKSINLEGVLAVAATLNPKATDQETKITFTSVSI